MEKEIRTVIMMGENVNAEFKEATRELPRKLFETVCSFLNTNGGYIILGVRDNKEIVGINKNYVAKLKKDYTTMCNNKEIINPTIISHLKEIEIDGKLLLYVYIEEASGVHTRKNKVFYRNYEGDFDITSNISLVASIHNHKNKIYDEDTIYPYVSISEDLDHALIDRARNLANSNLGLEKKHVWMDMDDLELLRSAGLYKKDKVLGKEGVTLAGVLLFGKDTTIRSVTPLCITDTLLRVDDLDRYDDRDFIETNLLDMYDRIYSFIAKHTKDRFTLDVDTRRVSSRNIMVKEMIINTLMHRDFVGRNISRVIVYEDKLVCENPNSFGTMSFLTDKNYTPVAKNPILAKFFREIGYSDYLGSGIKKMVHYSYLYSGDYPVFEDKEIFRVTIPLNRVKNTFDIVSSDKLEDRDVLKGNRVLMDVLGFIEEDGVITINELMNKLNKSRATVKRYLDVLRDEGYIKRVGSRKSGYWEVLRNGPVNELINEPINEPINVPNNDVKNSIYKLIRGHNNITISELANKLNIGKATVKRYLNVLRDERYIKRVGSRKSGYWEVLK